MTEFLTFTVIGLALGAVYAIAAAGLVVTYTTSGIFNFAHGAVGMLAAFLYWQLRFDDGWGGQWPAPLALAFVLLVAAPVLGIIVERVLMRSLVGTSEVTKLVIPIALLLVFIGLANWIWQGNEARVPRPFFGLDSKVTIGELNILTHRLIVFGLAILLAVALRFLLYRTTIGITMRAVVDDRELAQLTGGRPDVASQASWAIGFMLAALAGILISPLLGSMTVLALTLVVVNAYAAAIFGRLRSLPLTFAGALVVGLMVSYWTWLSDTGQKWQWLSGLRVAMPVVVLFVFLLFLPQDRLRGTTVTSSKERFNVPTMTQAVAFGGLLVLVIAALVPMLTTSWESILGTGLAYGVVGLSLVLLTGYAGEVNLAPLAFAGIGAIVLYQFDVGPGTESGVGFILVAVAVAVAFSLLVLPAMGLTGARLLAGSSALTGTVFVLVSFFDGTSGTGIANQESASLTGFVLAGLITGAVGAVIALPALRLRGLYLGLATFAFSIFVENLVFKQRRPLQFNVPFYGDGEDIEINLFTNGALNPPRPAFFGLDFKDQGNMAILVAVVFALVGIGLVALRRSSYGRQLAAMRDSPAACATLGLNLTRLKLSVFTLSAAIAGFGGALLASQLRNVQEDSPFVIFNSLGLFMLVVVGGVGYVSGALLGGLMLGSMFIMMSSFWEKLAVDWASFAWLFDFVGDFVGFVGIGMAGIGLARNPSGIASQFADGFKVFHKPGTRPVLFGGIALLTALWALRVLDVIDGWTFVLIALPFFLLWGLLGEIAAARNEVSIPGPRPEAIGLDEPFTPADRKLIDARLGIPEGHAVRLGERDELAEKVSP